MNGFPVSLVVQEYSCQILYQKNERHMSHYNWLSPKHSFFSEPVSRHKHQDETALLAITLITLIKNFKVRLPTDDSPLLIKQCEIPWLLLVKKSSEVKCVVTQAEANSAVKDHCWFCPRHCSSGEETKCPAKLLNT